ncbi:hypothetical protein [Herminiimonas sp. CN]|uniref:phage adaptor protein n=1 Tax=Herminiimonas sp. CN TaxID=1349818 RepID=UPI000473B762|nr:hypothetical protein [Herminiimonas sp. CN]
MNSTELRDQFRADVVDQMEPFLWSDPEIYDYLDDAQKMFCRLTGGLGDASTLLTVLNYTPASDWVPLSALILKLRNAYNVTDGLPIEVINFEGMAQLRIRFDGRTGRVKYLITGMEPGKARLYPAPDAVGTIQLLVDRLPLKTIDDEDQKLEVADQHKTGLGLWMKSRAYSKQDAETFDRNKAEGFEQKFRVYCADAKKEKDRAKHKTRVVQYGGL